MSSSKQARPEPEAHLQLRAELRSAMEAVEGVFPADRYPNEVPIGKLRRRRRGVVQDPTLMMTLVEVDGVLLWENGAGHSAAARGLRRGVRRGMLRGDAIERVQAEKLEVSDIGRYLSGLDKQFTPSPGLRQWNGSVLQPAPAGQNLSAGPILLFVHGTYSNNDHFFQELRATKDGLRFLARAAKHYKQILAFDHPTLSVSPVLNALDLARCFEGAKADIDVICHSRGGLVTRWWLETLDRGGGRRRAVLVGSPLDGTSLASPPRLRNVLSWFTNLNRALSAGAGAASSFFPFLTVVSALLRVTASVSNLAAKTPVIDAAIAMIPGLAAMSRIDNNFELLRLNIDGERSPQYFAVVSDFQTEQPGWEFWRYFVDLKARALNAATDLVFTEGNDLVVNTSSMTVLSKQLAVRHVYDFKTTDRVHHTNYFRQPETLQFIAGSLKIP